MTQGCRLWYAVATTRGLGPKRQSAFWKEMRDRDLSVEDLAGWSASDLRTLGVSASFAEDLATALADPPEPPRTPSWAQMCCPADDLYPAHRLDSALPPPVVLYAGGNLSLFDQPAIAVSGQRSAPPAALDVARRLGALIAEAGLNLVTGYARGADTEAHDGAIAADGTATAVLAEGIASFTQRSETRARKDSILVASQFAPDEPWSGRRAMARNATIAALADAVVVVSAGQRGGSWEQAQVALKHDIPLFVTDFDETAGPGNRALISQGARPFPPGDLSEVIAQTIQLAEGAVSVPTSVPESLLD